MDRLFSPPKDSGGDLALSEPFQPPPSSTEGPLSHEPSPLTSITPSSRGPRLPTARAYVELQHFPRAELEQYKPLADRPLTFAEAFPEWAMECIIGEYKIGSKDFYYVKLSDGLAYRVRTTPLF